MTAAQSFGERLRAAMKRKGVKNPEVAAAVGVHPITVSKWRSGTQPIEPARLPLLAEFLGVSVEWLRDDPQDMLPGIAEQLNAQPDAPRHARNLPLAVREYLAEFQLRLVKGGASEEEIEEAMRLLKSPDVFSYFKGGRLTEFNEEDLLNGMRAIGEDVIIPRLRKLGRKVR